MCLVWSIYLFQKMCEEKRKWLKAVAINDWACLVAQKVNNLPAVQETRVRSLGWENPLEKEMATCSSILAWEIPWTEEPGGLQSMGSQRVRHDWGTNTSILPFFNQWSSYLWHWLITCKSLNLCTFPIVYLSSKDDKNILEI